jgi:serine/threonine protein kinase/nitrite reductase/ring-hydroxylating ferredoxin subunit
MVANRSFDKLVGTKLGNYYLEQLIEQSELGPIFLAHTEAEAKTSTCVLRLLTTPADLPSEARIVYLGRFQQLANQITALQHPNILPLLDYGNSQGMPYLVVPNLPMKSLSAHLAKHGPLDALTASRYLDSIASALEYAHEQAMLHRNLSTDIIFILRDGRLCVADFGVMRMLELARREGQAYPFSGNGEGRAPEQILDQPVDTYTDVYALGAVLYRMLTGHRVFRGKTRDEIAQQHLRALVPPLSTWRNDLPAALGSVITTAMAKDPKQRFRQPGLLANAYATIVAPNDTTRKAFAVTTPAPASSEAGAAKKQQLHIEDVKDLNIKEAAAQADVAKKQQPAPAARFSAPQRQTQISRRRALTLLAAGGGAVVAVAAIAVVGSRFLGGTSTPSTANTGSTPLPAGSTPQGTTATGQGHTGRVIAHKSDLPLNSAKTFDLPNAKNPGVLVHLSDDRFVAFDSTCTHQGCPVAYNAQDKLLECPCHGATFDPARDAAVVAGPAPTPLTQVKITVNTDGTITQEQ